MNHKIKNIYKKSNFFLVRLKTNTDARTNSMMKLKSMPFDCIIAFAAFITVSMPPSARFELFIASVPLISRTFSPSVLFEGRSKKRI